MKNTSPSIPVYAILLAGGSGTRLWPLSRSLTPKHLLPLIGKESLLQRTARRLLPEIPSDRIITVTHRDHEFEARKQLAQVDEGLTQNLLAEPERKNTLPAIAWGVSIILKEVPEALVGVFPSDQEIKDEKKFLKIIREAFAVADKGFLVTLGIKPTYPATGFAYIKAGDPLQGRGPASRIASFVEKPDEPTAHSFLQKGHYYWNAGIFLFKTSVFQEEFKRLQPSLFKATEGLSAQNVTEIYTTLPTLSIDYGIMEKTDRGAVVPGEFEWSDVGSWEAVYQMSEKGERENVARGEVIDRDSKASLLISRGKGTLATIGLNGMIVVQTDDAVLVSPRNRTQEVKEIVSELEKRKSQLVTSHLTETRPWGSFTILEEGEGYKVKRITVNPGQSLSLQKHAHRSEHWVVTRGIGKITNGESVTTLKENKSTFIPRGEKHRIENPGKTPLEIIEVQIGSNLSEDDIIRLEDIYGRL